MNRQKLLPPLALERALAAPSPRMDPRLAAKCSGGTLDGAELRRLVAAMIG